MILYDEHQDYHHAMHYLKLGETVAEELNDDELLSKYYESLFAINDQAQIIKREAYYSKKFLENSMKQQKADLLARSFNAMSTTYVRLQQYDSSFIFITKSIPYLDSLPSNERVFFYANLGNAFLRRRDYKQAKEYFQKALEIAPKDNAYYAMGSIYEKENNKERAYEAWKKAMTTKDIELKTMALNAITKLCVKQGRFEEACSFYSQIVQLKDSVHTAIDKAAMEELQRRYDLEASNNRYYKLVTKILIGIVLSLIFVISIIAFFRMKIRKYVNTIEKERENIRQAENIIAELEDSGKGREKEVDRLRRYIKKKQDNIAVLITQGENVYNGIIAGKSIRTSEDEASFIEYYIMHHHDKFKQWSEEYTALTKRMTSYLILLDSGYSEARIKEILGMSDGAFRTLKSRLKSSRNKFFQ